MRHSAALQLTRYHVDLEGRWVFLSKNGRNHHFPVTKIMYHLPKGRSAQHCVDSMTRLAICLSGPKESVVLLGSASLIKHVVSCHTLLFQQAHIASTFFSIS